MHAKSGMLEIIKLVLSWPLLSRHHALSQKFPKSQTESHVYVLIKTSPVVNALVFILVVFLL